MAYTGASTPNTSTGGTSGDLLTDIRLDVIEAYKRRTIFSDKIRIDMLPNGASAGSFTIEGKEDATDGPTVGTPYVAGSQVQVSNGTQAEIIVPVDRPQYESRRIDKWDESVARYDVIAMQVRQLGSRLANAVDRKISAALETAAGTTGLVGNGDGHVLVNVKLPGGTGAASSTASEMGDAIGESIYAAAAAIRSTDDFEDLYVALSPTNYSYLPQSEKAVNADFTNGNGGFDSGVAKDVGGVMVFQSNNIPATAGLVGIVWSREGAGMVKLWDPRISINEQPEFLDAKLINAYFSNGIKPLRSNSVATLMNV